MSIKVRRSSEGMELPKAKRTKLSQESNRDIERLQKSIILTEKQKQELQRVFDDLNDGTKSLDSCEHKFSFGLCQVLENLASLPSQKFEHGMYFLLPLSILSIDLIYICQYYRRFRNYCNILMPLVTNWNQSSQLSRPSPVGLYFSP